MDGRSRPPAPHQCRSPVDEVRRLKAVHDAVHGNAPGRAAPRELISESWRRCREAGVDTEVEAAPLVFDSDVIDDARSAHPLDRHLPQIHGMLARVVDETSHVMVVTDAEGHALWIDGPNDVRRKADTVGLTEGSRWAEGVVGTNGIGTALALGQPSYIYSAEHLALFLHPWSCAGAPVIDPDSGSVIGCIDVSATVEALHPATVALVEAAARLTETRLEIDMRARDERLRERHRRRLSGPSDERRALVTATGRILGAEPGVWRGRRVAPPVPGGRVRLPDGTPAVAEPLGEIFLLRRPGRAAAADGRCRARLSLGLLGDGTPEVRLDGRPMSLSMRHAEILALLALHPRGLNADQLSWYLYGDEGNPVTIRAEIHRLRARLGDIVRARPYRLDCEVDADFLTVRRLLDAGDVAGAARLYVGDLLPRSESPELHATRHELAARLRDQVLRRLEPDALWRFAQTETGREDAQILEHLLAVLPPDHPRCAAARSRLAALTP